MFKKEKYFTVPRKDFYYWFMELVKSGYHRKRAYKKVCKFYNTGHNIN
tara:strand:+ start:979 stop:1122 length:144 start_codon:yes stop_codon:yes gene_type:complete